ncbi:MAG: methyltransferase [Gaiellaceae bacterium]
MNEDVLYRLLRALASDGVFVEEPVQVFANTPASELLRRDHPQSWPDFAHLFGDLFYRMFSDAEGALRTGAATFPATFGVEFWTWLKEHPAEGAVFNRAMAGSAEDRVDDLEKLDWADETVVVDVGGGNGAVLVELLRRRPRLRGIVHDLPETAAEAEEVIARAGLGDRCTVVAGSFFESVPTGDVYVLSRILHDWDDERAARILSTIGAAAPTHARLVIRDAVIPQDNEPHGSKWLDLLMLLVAGGRERKEDEWHTLLAGAGFRAQRLEDGLIEAVPA